MDKINHFICLCPLGFIGTTCEMGKYLILQLSDSNFNYALHAKFITRKLHGIAPIINKKLAFLQCLMQGLLKKLANEV